MTRWPSSARAVAGALLALGVAVATRSAVSAQVPAEPTAVKILRCTIGKPRPFSHHATGTEIRFVNTGPVVLHDIRFAVDYQNAEGSHQRMIDDAGRFAPNEPVIHHYDAFSDVDYAGSQPSRCVVSAVR